MLPMITDGQAIAYSSIVVAAITIIPTTLAAYWSRQSKQNSHEAKSIATEVAKEVRTNGGMSDPQPNINDHIKYQTEMLEDVVAKVDPLVEKVNEVDETLQDHIRHSRQMDRALAEVYLTVKPNVSLGSDDE